MWVGVEGNQLIGVSHLCSRLRYPPYSKKKLHRIRWLFDISERGVLPRKLFLLFMVVAITAVLVQVLTTSNEVLPEYSHVCSTQLHNLHLIPHFECSIAQLDMLNVNVCCFRFNMFHVASWAIAVSLDECFNNHCFLLILPNWNSGKDGAKAILGSSSLNKIIMANVVID